MKKLLLVSMASLVPMLLTANTVITEKVQPQQVKPAATPNHAVIDTQIQEIKPARIGVKSSDVMKTKSPFLMFRTGKHGKKAIYAKKKRVKLPPLKMESVINKNVKINGKWYKEGDRVRQYTIVKVSSGEAVLKSKKKELKLFQDRKNDKINFNVN